MTSTFATAADVTDGRVVVAEDHHPEGGLGSAVADALLQNAVAHIHLAHLAVRDMPGSGTADELLTSAGVDAENIAYAAKGLFRSS
jgi:transketolase